MLEFFFFTPKKKKSWSLPKKWFFFSVYEKICFGKFKNVVILNSENRNETIWKFVIMISFGKLACVFFRSLRKESLKILILLRRNSENFNFDFWKWFVFFYPKFFLMKKCVQVKNYQFWGFFKLNLFFASFKLEKRKWNDLKFAIMIFFNSLRLWFFLIACVFFFSKFENCDIIKKKIEIFNFYFWK